MHEFKSWLDTNFIYAYKYILVCYVSLFTMRRRFKDRILAFVCLCVCVSLCSATIYVRRFCDVAYTAFCGAQAIVAHTLCDEDDKKGSR